MSAVDDIVTKSAVGDKQKSQRSATFANVSERRHQGRGWLSTGGQVRCYGTLTKVESVAFNESVFGRMLGYGDVIVRGTLRNDRVVCQKRKPVGRGMLLERKVHSPIRLILKPTNTLILSKS
jgi:hypothetical protein